MFSSQCAEVSLDAPCRAISAVSSDRVDNRFLVGSCRVPRRHHQQGAGAGDKNNNSNNNKSRSSSRNPTATNQLFAIRFHSDINELGIDAALEHPTGPIQSIACNPSDCTLVATSTQQLQLNNHAAAAATVWKLPREIMEETGGIQYDPEEEENNNNDNNNGAAGAAPKASMEALLTLPTTESCGKPVTDMAWRQTSLELNNNNTTTTTSGDLLTVDPLGTVQLWDVEKGTSTRTCRNSNNNKSVSTAAASLLYIPPRIAWDPHSSYSAAVTRPGGRVQIFDWRTDQSIPSGMVEHFTAHRSCRNVVDLDFNPNKPFVLATSGTDGLIKYWDLRSQAKHPLLTCRGGHSHWVSNVLFNPFHDQLVLSTGTDAMVNLWSISSISSAPLLDDDCTNGNSGENNKRVATFEHSNACYAAAWGAADAWVYTTVGYEGKVVLHHVPSKEKYKILL